MLEDEGAVAQAARRSPTIWRRPTRSSLYGRTIGERLETRRLVAWFDSSSPARSPTSCGARSWSSAGSAGIPRSEALRDGSRNIRTHLAYIAGLYQARKWLAGDTLTMADIAAAAHLSVLDYMGDVPWADAGGPRLVRQDQVPPLDAPDPDGPAGGPEAAAALRRPGLLSLAADQGRAPEARAGLR